MKYRRILFIAHRGGIGNNSFNSIPVFWNTIQIGVDFIEADVQFTKDQKLILFHDDCILRKTGEKSNLHELTLDEVRKIGAENNNWNINETAKYLPQLEDLIRLSKNRTNLLLDLKCSDNDYLELILNQIIAQDMEMSVVLGVRSVEALRFIKKKTIRYEQ